jgi:hypothetical protein
MRKKALLVGFVFVLATAAVCASAYADGGSSGSGWTDFWNGVGGFIHNAMPWNWGKSS